MGYIADDTNIFANLRSLVESNGITAILDALARIALDKSRELRTSQGKSENCKAWREVADYLDLTTGNLCSILSGRADSNQSDE